MKLPELKHSVRALPPRTLRKLEAWLHELITTLEAAKRERIQAKRAQPIQKTYRLEGVRCGNASCKCRQGKLHGPYWYAYWREGGKTRSQYVGKHRPADARKQPRRKATGRHK
jgi:hypothetical protein